MIPSKAKKEDSGSCKFALAQSSKKMNAYLRQLSSYLFVDIQEHKRGLVNEILLLLCNIIFFLCHYYLGEYSEKLGDDR